MRSINYHNIYEGSVDNKPSLPKVALGSSTIVFLDGGHFVSRFSRHWNPKGVMRRADKAFKAKRISWTERQARFRKAIVADIGYVSYRLGNMKANPKYEDSCVIVCYDGIFSRRRRGALYEGYKGNRSGGGPTETYAASQHEGADVRDKLQKMGLDPDKLEKDWHGCYIQDYEADDLIAEMAVEALNHDKAVIVLSSDADFVQLLRNPNLRLHNLSQEILNEDVLEKYGVSPEQFADWKALSGDVSDNIPGVPGIGKKKAATLLTQYGSIEEIPQDYFRHYRASSSIELAERLSSFRQEKGWSLSRCKREFGAAWSKLEDGLEVIIDHKQVRKLTEAVDISGLLSFDDYYNKALLWRRLVTLPFK